MRMDINADAGESFGRWNLGDEAALFENVTTVNIACGFHAGDPATMRASVRAARDAGLSIGAHPGYPDLLGFGRRQMGIPDADLVDYVVYQTGALAGIAATEGVRLTHVKPHGALYGTIAASAGLASAIGDALARFQPGIAVLLAPGPGSEALLAAGHPVLLDNAVDLDFDADGHNIIEPRPAAKDPQLVADRAALMATGRVDTVAGTVVDMPVRTICVHGDRPNAPAVASAVRHRLEAEGHEVRSAFEESA